MSTTLSDRPAEVAPLARLRLLAQRRTEWRAVILLMVVLTVTAFTVPIVFTAYETTLARIALVGLVSLGLTMVVLQGELDLSVGSTVALAGVVLALIPDWRVGVPVALLTGVAFGMLNAFFVVVVGINSFIATLGSLFMMRGIALVLSDAEPVRLAYRDEAIAFSQPLLGPITPRVVLFFTVFALLQLFLTRTQIGRETFAVGGNRQAARDAGIPVKRRIFTAFMMSGFVAALAGVITSLEFLSADPTAGTRVLLASFAAVIIGGTLLNGGRGSLLGTLIGAASLGLMEIGLTFAGQPREVQDVLIGLVLLVAVVSDPNSVRWLARRLRTFAQRLSPRAVERADAPREHETGPTAPS